MRLRSLVLACLAASATTSLCLGQPSAPAGYLTPQTAPDTLKILPPAPKTGDPQDTADQAVFKATRSLANSPRWTLAQNDRKEGVDAVLRDFSCAVGLQLDPDRAVKLAALLRRMRPDVENAVNGPKNLYKRPRPYQVTAGPICVDKDPAMATSPDYPSGHATWGWSVGLVLAELAPDRATPILVRARAFGESRVVCGVHNASSVSKSRTNASAVIAALHGEAAFRADLDGARAELAALRAQGGPTPADCEAEAAQTARTPW